VRSASLLSKSGGEKPREKRFVSVPRSHTTGPIGIVRLMDQKKKGGKGGLKKETERKCQQRSGTPKTKSPPPVGPRRGEPYGYNLLDTKKNPRTTESMAGEAPCHMGPPQEAQRGRKKDGIPSNGNSNRNQDFKSSSMGEKKALKKVGTCEKKQWSKDGRREKQLLGCECRRAGGGCRQGGVFTFQKKGSKKIGLTSTRGTGVI